MDNISERLATDGTLLFHLMESLVGTYSRLMSSRPHRAPALQCWVTWRTGKGTALPQADQLWGVVVQTLSSWCWKWSQSLMTNPQSIQSTKHPNLCNSWRWGCLPHGLFSEKFSSSIFRQSGVVWFASAVEIALIYGIVPNFQGAWFSRISQKLFSQMKELLLVTAGTGIHFNY